MSKNADLVALVRSVADRLITEAGRPGIVVAASADGGVTIAARVLVAGRLAQTIYWNSPGLRMSSTPDLGVYWKLRPAITNASLLTESKP